MATSTLLDSWYLKVAIHITLLTLGIVLITEQPSAVAKIYQENENRTISENPLFVYNLFGVYVAAIAFALTSLFSDRIQEYLGRKDVAVKSILLTCTDIIWIVVVVGFAGIDMISEFFGVLVVTFTVTVMSYFPIEGRYDKKVSWPRLFILIALTGYSLGVIIQQAQIDIFVCADGCNTALRMAAVILGYMPIITGTFLFKMIEKLDTYEKAKENNNQLKIWEDWDIMHILARILILVALWETPFTS